MSICEITYRRVEISKHLISKIRSKINTDSELKQILKQHCKNRNPGVLTFLRTILSLSESDEFLNELIELIKKHSKIEKVSHRIIMKRPDIDKLLSE